VKATAHAEQKPIEKSTIETSAFWLWIAAIAEPCVRSSPQRL
jgi:hypothetical protein